jgi:hypothetical protein
VDQATIQQLLLSGGLTPDDIVWTNGMAQWTPIRQVPTFLSMCSTPAIHSSDGRSLLNSPDQKSGLPSSLVKSAAGSRPWVIFLSVISFIYAGLLFVVGILSLIYGANNHIAPVVADGLFAIVLAIDIMAGGFLLSTFAGRLGGLHHSGQSVVLEKAMDTLHNILVYFGINLIVALTFLGAALIWAIAISGTLPWS